MKPRRNIRLAIIVALAIAGIVLWNMSRVPEAYYQGKSATYWLKQVGTSGLEGPALRAFREMGTNAYPVILAALDSKGDSPSYRRLRVRMFSVPYIGRFFPVRSEQENLRAGATEIAMRPDLLSVRPCLLDVLNPTNPVVQSYTMSLVTPPVLGSGHVTLSHWPVLFSLGGIGASSLERPFIPGVISNQVPLFASLITNVQFRFGALDVLGYLGPAASNAIPAISNACLDPFPTLRVSAAWQLWRISRQTNTAVPVLEAALNPYSPGTSTEACEYLLQIEGNQPALMSFLIQSLTNADLDRRMFACSQLPAFGSAAKDAVPDLLVALHDTNVWVQNLAKNALLAIDPKTAATNSISPPKDPRR